MTEYKLIRSIVSEHVEFNGRQYVGLFNTISKSELAIPKKEWEDVQSDPSAYSNTEVRKQLIENNFLIKKIVDEKLLLIKRLTDSAYFSETLKFKVLMNRTCNFRCTYCFEKPGVGVMNMKTARDTLRFIAERIDQRRPRRVVLEISGGEFFLNFDIASFLARETKNLCDGKDIRFELNATTNGSMITREKIELLQQRGLNILRVSMAGPESLHNSLRPDRNNRETYSLICGNLQLLPDSVDLIIECQYPPDTDHYLQIPDLIDDLANKNIRVKNYVFSSILPGRGDNPCRVSLEDPKKAIYLKHEAARREFPMYDIPVEFGCAADLDHQFFTIDYDGSILPCPCLKPGEFAAGSVVTGIDYISRSQLYRPFPDECLTTCNLTGSCNLGCRLFRLLESDKFDGITCPAAILEPLLKDHIKYKTLECLSRN